MIIPIKEILLEGKILNPIGKYSFPIAAGAGAVAGGLYGSSLVPEEAKNIHNNIENINSILPEDQQFDNGNPVIIGTTMGGMLGAALGMQAHNKIKKVIR